MEMTESYTGYIEALKSEIKSARVKAALSVNKELVLLYWKIGKNILEMQEKEGWGAKVIEQVSKDLRSQFPEMKGLSARNLKYMRAFASFCSDFEIVQQLVAQTPWGHITHSMDKVDNTEEFIWYIQKTIENGWSRNVLVMQIESKLYERQGKAITNFKETLPAPQSDLAQQIMKSEYNFEFLGLTEEVREATLEKSLIDNIRDFLLELGTGFSFIGSQHRVSLAGEEFYIDLLMYHIKLKCYVVIELKAGKFKPEYAGKLGFYTTAIDHEIRDENDNETIGILLCQSSNKLMAEYCLKDNRKPLGVAEYKTLPKKYEKHLPSPGDFQKVIQSLDQ